MSLMVHCRCLAVALAGILGGPAAAYAQAAVDVTTPGVPYGFDITTYHYDNLRTGWNKSETTLTPENVAAASFGPLHTVAVDEQVDAQPLYVASQQIQGQSAPHDDVFVATENNTVYAIDADSGSILLQRNFGTPVPKSTLPGVCYTNSVVVGISSTPVIDPVSQSLYVITDTYEASTPTLRLHKLRLSDLSDKVSPASVIAATGTKRDGKTVSFSALEQHQRAALLLSRGNVYAGFASYCDASIGNHFSRGWVLAWRADTIAPSGGDRLLNERDWAPTPMFQTSVWMSGSGIAADPNGNVYFVTGNSDWKGGTYNKQYNLSESAISFDQTLTTLRTFFTPHDVNTLDQSDVDFGSGGIMLLPPQPGTSLNLATAMGKAGILYLLNRDDMGGHTPGGPDNVLDQETGGPCWCGESYFTGADGANRVVSSGGSTLMTWKVDVQSASSVVLVADKSTTLDYNGQFGGFNTSVSSDGSKHGVIWAVGRPRNRTNNAVRLFAFDANTGTQLTEQTAGNWVHVGGDANIVPVVASGKVLVASYKQLQIFGLTTAATAAASSAAENAPLLAAAPDDETTGHVTYGTVDRTQDNQITLRTRNGEVVTIEISPQTRSYAPATPGAALQVRALETAGVLTATVVLPASADPASWGGDH
jgi:hypothetical protein